MREGRWVVRSARVLGDGEVANIAAKCCVPCDSST